MGVLETTVASFAPIVAPIVETREARKDEKRARAAERRIQDVKAARERRRVIREARIARADVEAGAQATGAGTSSGAITGSGTIGTQLAANLSFLDTVQGLQTEANIFREKAAKHRGRAADAQALTDIAKQGVSLFVGGA